MTQLSELREHLIRTEPSLAVNALAALTKALVLAGASEMESDVQTAIESFYFERLESHPHGALFVVNKALKRQYHTFFNWEDRSANQFFGLFGPDFSAVLKLRGREDSEFKSALDAFLQIGDLRNRIVHNNFAAFTLDLSAEEVHELCVLARGFVDELPEILRASYPVPS